MSEESRSPFVHETAFKNKIYTPLQQRRQSLPTPHTKPQTLVCWNQQGEKEKWVQKLAFE